MSTHLISSLPVPSALLPAGLAGGEQDGGGNPTYLGDFRFLWEELSQKYPKELFEAKGIDWAAVKAEFEPRAAAARTDEEFVRLCIEVVGRLKDGHAYVECKSIPADKLYPADDRINPGAGFVECADGSIAVLRVYPNSSAEKAGLKPGMRVKTVDGEDAKAFVDKAAKARWDRGGVSSERAARFSAAWLLLSGPKGSTVKLGVEVPGAAGTRAAVLERSFGQLLRCPKLGDYPPPDGLKNQGRCSYGTVQGRGGKYGYLYLLKFDGRDGGKADIEKALEDFRKEKVRGLIVDVRGNGGGGVPAVEWPKELRVVLIIDPGTFSAGEGFAAYVGWSKEAPQGHPGL
ncbi:MAG: S41 family peptidase, partial [Planctomycetes bacterium]|nr:S41 family peptidase [Planctomycetota bacterium]